MDRILMQGMSFYSYTGVLASEKTNGQIFLVDVELEMLPILACETDRLTDTVNYAEAYEIIRKIFERESFDLVERLCGVIVQRLLQAFSLVNGVIVTVRKPQAPIIGQFEAMGVRIHRQRNQMMQIDT
jgi:dihydroneopterin aldolase